ncbi:hypothetical protein HPT27_13720 [Permianibacter sp. IMCC34836]|uniref:hypothetical protein n=1 Tax=Permianibacter fluminis TaxID=2738515 RepID=UPI001552E0A8|nr:hypothetical protein [Permianibacter fluminis]NQD38086.1 hypothetical protein [Permianibacter fluminis]
MKATLKLFFFLSAMLLFGCDESDKGAQELQSRGAVVNKLSLSGDYQRAADEAVKLAKDFPGSAKAQFLAAFYLGRKAQMTESHPFSNETANEVRKYLSKGFAIGPDDVETEWGAALVYAGISAPREAMSIFLKYKDDNEFLTREGRIDTFSDFAYLIADSGDLPESLEVMDAALAANPGHDSLAQEKVRLLTKFSTIEEVELFAKSFESQFGFRETIQYQVCSAYKYRQLKEKAIKCFNALLAVPDLSEEEREMILSDMKN